MFTPNLMEEDSSAVPESSYIVTAEEIAGSKMATKLVVISGCWSYMDRDYVESGFQLPGAFIAAGLFASIEGNSVKPLLFQALPLNVVYICGHIKFQYCICILPRV